MPQEVKDCVCLPASSSCTKKPSLKELVLSLQVAFAETEIISLGLVKGITEEEAKKLEMGNNF